MNNAIYFLREQLNFGYFMLELRAKMLEAYATDKVNTGQNYRIRGTIFLKGTTKKCREDL